MPMRPASLVLLGLLATAACAPQQGIEFVPSQKSAVELRAIQSRTVPGDAQTVMRGVIATLHDLGYRINKAEPQAGLVSATRATALAMTVVVQDRPGNTSVVRANATIRSALREGQVDAPEFYQNNFFLPLAAHLNRDLMLLRPEEAAPEAVRPVAEVNSAAERARAAGPTTTTPAPAPAQPATR